MFCEPLAGWPQVSVRERRTKVDWAQEMESLPRTRYQSAKKVIPVCDNLNAHSKSAFYEAFQPRMARSLVQRLEFCHTPKHGSWLNFAENELSSMTWQCVTGRRFATIEELSVQTTAWHEHSNARQRTVDCQVDGARVKLKSIYPKLEV
jgi:DDE superfamily endonuclease